MAKKAVESILVCSTCQTITGLTSPSTSKISREMDIGQPQVKAQPLREPGPSATAIQFSRSPVFKLTLTLHITLSRFPFFFACLISSIQIDIRIMMALHGLSIKHSRSNWRRTNHHASLATEMGLVNCDLSCARIRSPAHPLHHPPPTPV